ncbi:MAG: DMT family transporter [Candidatus Marinimicrobia bacterium]|mgnify:CR=1 FL=1|jgi:drug/metabolite transporter (DMT)-like permease|nr:DMT family transporter [Candidatus Neomarinimicrobiota bacterium]MBT3633094.1 DMT family transporter [Candidatus Neomarinimicrobiota bacterium]MBT3682305.1 DMT family transporter [Candidatus Neomarinimicrobiota bacterium]MBT3758694.1 DMT family transporter [Candidatus Neomarinimicrobiota bacterium]MBT3895432.1 DMT family transporter [Candidatus Neomarinimicrobiota bacterium]
MENFKYTGEIFSLLSAVFWGLAVVFFKKTGETISPVALNPFKNVLASVLFLITILVVQEPLLQPFDATGVNGFSVEDYVRLILSGIIGIGIADLIFFKSLNILGAGFSAIIDTLYSPSVIFFAFIMLGERLNFIQLLGAMLVVSAVLFASFRLKNIPSDPKELRYGLFLGIAAISMMGFGIVLVKPVLNKLTSSFGQQMWVAGFRLIFGSIFSIIIFAIVQRKRDLIKPFYNKKIWFHLITGSVLGTYIGLACWLIGMTHATASIASILNQTATIFILLFAWLFLKEPMSWRRVFSVVLAMAGVYLVMLG